MTVQMFSVNREWQQEQKLICIHILIRTSFSPLHFSSDIYKLWFKWKRRWWIIKEMNSSNMGGTLKCFHVSLNFPLVWLVFFLSFFPFFFWVFCTCCCHCFFLCLFIFALSHYFAVVFRIFADESSYHMNECVKNPGMHASKRKKNS